MSQDMPAQGKRSHHAQGKRTHHAQGKRTHHAQGKRSHHAQGKRAHHAQGKRAHHAQGKRSHHAQGKRSHHAQGKRSHHAWSRAQVSRLSPLSSVRTHPPRSSLRTHPPPPHCTYFACVIQDDLPNQHTSHFVFVTGHLLLLHGGPYERHTDVHQRCISCTPCAHPARPARPAHACACACCTHPAHPAHPAHIPHQATRPSSLCTVSPTLWKCRWEFLASAQAGAGNLGCLASGAGMEGPTPDAVLLLCQPQIPQPHHRFLQGSKRKKLRSST